MEMTAGGNYSMWCNTLLWNDTCNELQFFQNFQHNPRNFSGIFREAFPQSTCLVFSGTAY